MKRRFKDFLEFSLPRVACFEDILKLTNEINGIDLKVIDYRLGKYNSITEEYNLEDKSEDELKQLIEETYSKYKCMSELIMDYILISETRRDSAYKLRIDKYYNKGYEIGEL